MPDPEITDVLRGYDLGLLVYAAFVFIMLVWLLCLLFEMWWSDG